MDKKLPEDRYKLEIFVEAQNLMDVDTFSKSDPVCKLFYTLQGEQEQFLGSTEVKKNDLNPKWEKTFLIDYVFELNQDLKFQVWDKDSSAASSDECIGQTTLTVADIIGSKDQRIESDLLGKKKKITGKLIVQLDKQAEPDRFAIFKWKGIDLMNTDGYFGKSDPFLKFFKKIGDKLYLVHKTEMIKDNLNPQWKSFEISTAKLCNGDDKQLFKVECWDVHDKGENNQYMGCFETSLFEIFNENKTSFNLDYKPGKSGGNIVLEEKKIDFRPTFMDYLRNGEQINLVIGIDFTAQNGDITFADSLHQQKTDGTMNAYETAMKHCAQVLLNYDSDKKVAIYGFGGIPHFPNYNRNDTEHCFPLTGDYSKPELFGMDGIMNIYKQQVKMIEFSGPALLFDLLNYTKIVADSNAKKKIYTVLLILTCGQIHDFQKTIDLITTCQKSPLSVIIVGIGEFDFKKMELLDQDQRSTSSDTVRNIVQFVEYKKYGHNVAILQRELLSELPHQLVQYKQIVGQKMQAP